MMEKTTLPPRPRILNHTFYLPANYFPTLIQSGVKDGFVLLLAKIIGKYLISFKTTESDSKL